MNTADTGKAKQDEELAGAPRGWLNRTVGGAGLTFLLLVRDPEHTPNPALKFFATLRGLPLRFRRYLGAVGLFGAGDFSHSLLILAATQLLTPSLGVVQAAQVAGLLYVGRNLVQVLLSYPIGALADRYGELGVLVLGYLMGVLTALFTALAFVLGANGMMLVILLGAIFFLAGHYVAVQEALEASVTAGMVEQGVRGVGYGALGTVNGVTKFVSSAGVGLLWTAVSPAVGFGLAALLMTAGTLALARLRGDG
jgi:MFS family permease